MLCLGYIARSCLEKSKAKKKKKTITLGLFSTNCKMITATLQQASFFFFLAKCRGKKKDVVLLFSFVLFCFRSWPKQYFEHPSHIYT